jgi:hypothetical protein
MLKTIYLALIARIKSFDSHFISQTYSKINHYDLFFNQYLDEALLQEHPFQLPAIFFEITADYKLLSHQTQQATVNLRVHVVQECYYDTADNSQDQLTALEILDLVDLVHNCLQGFSIPEISGRLNRTRIEPEVRPTNVYVYVLDYEFTADDNSTHRLKDFVNSSGNHNVTLNDTAFVDGGIKIAQKIPDNPIASGNYRLD